MTKSYEHPPPEWTRHIREEEEVSAAPRGAYKVQNKEDLLNQDVAVLAKPQIKTEKNKKSGKYVNVAR